MTRSIAALAASLTLLAACNGNTDKDHTTETPTTKAADNTPPVISFTVIKALPHDTSSYTEGFLFHNGQLFESTGTTPDMPATRRSLFGIVDSTTGRITPKVELDRKKIFGEGIVFLDGKIYQLTYTTKIGFIYDANTFKKIGEFTFPNKEGWGMTTDGRYIIMSDGSSNISYYDPTKLTPTSVSIEYDNGDKETKTLNSFGLAKVLGVTDNNGPVGDINELEMINGYLYANKYTTDYILKIDPASGKVVGMLNFESLAQEARSKYPGAEVMNGIAYDSTTGRIFVTGKLWANMYQVQFPH